MPNSFNQILRACMAASVAAMAFVTLARSEASAPTMSHEPMNDAVLWQLVASDSTKSLSNTLAILERLVGKEAWRQLQQPQQTAFRISLTRRFIYALLNAGSVSEAVKVFDALPEAVSLPLLNEVAQRGPLVLAGRNIVLDDSDLVTPRYPKPTDFRLEIAAALYLAGRPADANAVFKAIPYAQEARAFARCGHNEGSPDQLTCSQPSYTLIKWRLLELALERGDADAYDFIEDIFGRGRDGRLNTPLWIELLLRRVGDGDYSRVVRRATFWAGDLEFANDATAAAGVRERFDPALRARADAIAKIIAQLRDRLIGARQPGRDQHVALRSAMTVPPGLSRYKPVTVPKSCPPAEYKPGVEPKSVPASINRMSSVEVFWRLETSGSTIVVAGQTWSNVWEEEGLGGVWFHISRDGGKTWEKPLFTGIESNNRFFVRADGCLPLNKGDHLILEYGLMRVMRDDGKGGQRVVTDGGPEDRLAVDIPLAELQRDSDGDGLTDIAEEFLLLDPHNADSDHDGLSDGEDPFPNVKRAAASSLSGAMAQVLASVINSPGADKLLIRLGADGQESLHPQSPERPFLIAGDAAVFSGITADRVMLVYSEDELRQLAIRRMHLPLLRIGPIVLNRSKDHGFVAYDSGGSGGTIRFWREGATWKVAHLGGWIR